MSNRIGLRGVFRCSLTYVLNFIESMRGFCSMFICLFTFLLPSVSSSQTSDAIKALPGIVSLLLEPKICNPPPDYFVGEYLIEQESGVGPFSSILSVFDTQIVNITAAGNVRSFDFLYSPSTFASDFSLRINLLCGEMLSKGGINSGSLSCMNALDPAPQIGQSTGNTTSVYDDTFDDSEMTLYVLDFAPGEDGGCGVNPYEIELKFTKQSDD